MDTYVMHLHETLLPNRMNHTMYGHQSVIIIVI